MRVVNVLGIVVACCSCSPPAEKTAREAPASNAIIATAVQSPTAPLADDPIRPAQASSAAETSDRSPSPATTSAVPPIPQLAPARDPVYVARARRPAIVLGAVRPGRLEITNGCLVVKMDGQAVATAVLPPDAKLIVERGRSVRVNYPGRSIPIGEYTGIPGGGSSTSTKNLVSPLRSKCPTRLFPIGG